MSVKIMQMKKLWNFDSFCSKIIHFTSLSLLWRKPITCTVITLNRLHSIYRWIDPSVKLNMPKTFCTHHELRRHFDWAHWTNDSLLLFEWIQPRPVLLLLLLRDAQGTPLCLGNQESYHRSAGVKTTGKTFLKKN